MSKWTLSYHPDAEDEYDALDGSVRKMVFKSIEKVSQNPLPINEGGYGKPLSNKGGLDLTGLLKIKLKKLGLRVVYKLITEPDNVMKILVVSVRADGEVYRLAHKRMADV